MADSDVVWLVGRAEDLGTLDERLERLDATVEETWPGGINSEIVALVRSAPDAAEQAATALTRDVQRFDDEDRGRATAEEVARAHA